MDNFHAGFVLAEAMIQAGLLQEIRAPRLKERAPNGAVFITCGDRDRFSHHYAVCSGLVDAHPVCLNGGGVLLGNDVDDVRKQTILEETLEAFAIKGLRFVLDHSHFPCGKCTAKYGFGLRETLLKTLEGKAFLKEAIPKEKLDGILPLIGIDWRVAHIKREHGVKLYALRLQDMPAIANFGQTRRHEERCLPSRIRELGHEYVRFPHRPVADL